MFIFFLNLTDTVVFNLIKTNVLLIYFWQVFLALVISCTLTCNRTTGKYIELFQRPKDINPIKTPHCCPFLCTTTPSVHCIVNAEKSQFVIYY